MSHCLVRAPSNIALCKYMGKIDPARNLPANASLSLTLGELCTYVELRESATGHDRLVAETPRGARGESPALSEAGQAKFLRHVERFRARIQPLMAPFGIEYPLLSRAVEIRASNTFPAAAGIASSASAFAALTLALATFYARGENKFHRRWEADDSVRLALARLAREGSGSACRSMLGPWVSWEGEGVKLLPSRLPPMADLVVVVGEEAKKVGSSEAHARVLTSPAWPGRAGRATERHGLMARAIADGDLHALAPLAEEEFRDMHGLFHSANPKFTYFRPETEMVLDYLAHRRDRFPIVTMDAGPNVHVIVPENEADAWEEELRDAFPDFRLLRDEESEGAEILNSEADEEIGEGEG